MEKISFSEHFWETTSEGFQDDGLLPIIKDEGINTCLVVSIHPKENLSVVNINYFLMTYNSKDTCLSMIIVLPN